MIIYTSMPLELVYSGYDQQPAQYEEITHNGIMMQIEPEGPYSGRIIRLLSCNPQDYLKPEYSPGSIIHFRPS